MSSYFFFEKEIPFNSIKQRIKKLPALNDGERDKYEERLQHKNLKSRKIAINVVDTQKAPLRDVQQKVHKQRSFQVDIR